MQPSFFLPAYVQFNPTPAQAQALMFSGTNGGQAEKTHRIINSLLKRIATRHHIPIVAAKPISVTADQSREFEPAIWVGLRAWDVCLARATTTRVKDERKTFVKVEVGSSAGYVLVFMLVVFISLAHIEAACR